MKKPFSAAPLSAALLFAVLLLTPLYGCDMAEVLLGDGEPAATAAPEATEAPTVLDQSNMGLGDGNLGAYYDQKQLVSLDLTGNDLSVSAVSSLMAALPGCDIRWSVPLGGARYDSASTELTVDGPTGEELQNLTLFPQLAACTVSGCTDYAALAGLPALLPGVNVAYTVDVGGVVCQSTDEALDLTNAALHDGADLLAAMAALPNVKNVDLSGQALPAETLGALVDTYPETEFLWTVTLYGVTIESTAETADLGNANVTDLPGMGELREKLKLLPKLTRLDMCGCGVDEATMMALQDEYENVKFIFLLRIGAWEMRTDVKAFSKGNQHSFEGGKYLGPNMNLYDEDVAKLKYCTDLVALDIGHGFKLTNIEVVRYLPHLRFLIIAMQKIEDLTPIGTLTELEYLETFQNPVSDLTPLLNCKNLKCLNISTNVRKGENGKEYPDPAVIMQMTSLTRLWCIRDNFSKEDIAAIQAALPDCVICATGTHSTSNNWRDNDLYVEMQTLFNNPILD